MCPGSFFLFLGITAVFLGKMADVAPPRGATAAVVPPRGATAAVVPPRGATAAVVPPGEQVLPLFSSIRESTYFFLVHFLE